MSTENDNEKTVIEFTEKQQKINEYYKKWEDWAVELRKTYKERNSEIEKHNDKLPKLKLKGYKVLHSVTIKGTGETK